MPKLPDDKPMAPVSRPTVAVTKPAPARRSTRLGVPPLPNDEPVIEPERPAVQASVVSSSGGSRRVMTIPPRPVCQPPVYGPFMLEGELPF
ncbi:hypothetical protein D3272_15550 [Lichenibacterium ramalinae]|uniref:Uncharacterized protein n=1 Tax=Lichenibacterium ramalinae TaxID=2316527 RepID=A0A4Q2RBS6_9HYPH|nr:hypothetical protein D3272_15550 [Lichenibacterium ramalinae]